MNKVTIIKRIMNSIDTVYVNESHLHKSVKSSLSKLDLGELANLLLMIKTSK